MGEKVGGQGPSLQGLGGWGCQGEGEGTRGGETLMAEWQTGPGGERASGQLLFSEHPPHARLWGCQGESDRHVSALVGCQIY